MANAESAERQSSPPLRPIPRSPNLLRHQFRQRHKFSRDLGNIQVSRLLLPRFATRGESHTPIQAIGFCNLLYNRHWEPHIRTAFAPIAQMDRATVS